MPYASNKDLNPATKKAHPSEKGRTAFRKTFNAALHEYGDEATAFKVAHAAANKIEGPRRINIHIHAGRQKGAGRGR